MRGGVAPGYWQTAVQLHVHVHVGYKGLAKGSLVPKGISNLVWHSNLVYIMSQPIGCACIKINPSIPTYKHAHTHTHSLLTSPTLCCV